MYTVNLYNSVLEIGECTPIKTFGEVSSIHVEDGNVFLESVLGNIIFPEGYALEVIDQLEEE